MRKVRNRVNIYICMSFTLLSYVLLFMVKGVQCNVLNSLNHANTVTDESFTHKPVQLPKFVPRLHSIPSDSSQGDNQDVVVKEEPLETKDEPCEREADYSEHAIKDEPCQSDADQGGKSAATRNDCLNREILITPGYVEEQQSLVLFSLNDQTYCISSSSSASSHCSDCAKCVSDMVSPLSSPRLSQIKVCILGHDILIAIPTQLFISSLQYSSSLAVSQLHYLMCSTPKTFSVLLLSSQAPTFIF